MSKAKKEGKQKKNRGNVLKKERRIKEVEVLLNKLKSDK